MKTVRTAQNVAKDKKRHKKLLLRTKNSWRNGWMGKMVGKFVDCMKFSWRFLFVL